ncbi:MAG: 2-amino-3,7-dideoxy-D-threo-hept-6-ulosonate synthase [Bacillota bacterium]
MKGKEIRLRHLFRHSQRLFIVPMDHGVSVGPVAGIEDIGTAVASVAEGGADAVIVHKGLARHVTHYLKPTGCELIIHLSASTGLAPDPNRKELVSSVEHAIRLGATAVSAHVNLGAKSEAQMLKDLGMLAEGCDLWGMPLLAMMYVRDGTRGSEFDPAKIRHAARVAEEVGADIIKVNYTGSPETFAGVTAAVKVPVVIAGGPKMSSTAELLEMVADAVQAGAGGVAIGRNVFQDKKPALLSSAIRYILDNQVLKFMLKESLPLRFQSLL